MNLAKAGRGSMLGTTKVLVVRHPLHLARLPPLLAAQVRLVHQALAARRHPAVWVAARCLHTHL